MTGARRMGVAVLAAVVLAAAGWSMEPPARLPDGMIIHVAMRPPAEMADRLAQFVIAATSGTPLEGQAQFGMMMMQGTANGILGFPSEAARPGAWHFVVVATAPGEGVVPPSGGFLIPVADGGRAIKEGAEDDGAGNLKIETPGGIYKILDAGGDFLLLVPEDEDKAFVAATVRGWKPVDVADGAILSITLDMASLHRMNDAPLDREIEGLKGTIISGLKPLIDMNLPRPQKEVVNRLAMLVMQTPAYLTEMWGALGTVEMIRSDVAITDDAIRNRIWIAARDGSEFAAFARAAAALPNTEVALAGKLPASSAFASGGRSVAMPPSMTAFFSRVLTDMGAVVNGDTARALGAIPAKAAAFLPYDMAQAQFSIEPGMPPSSVTISAVKDPVAFRDFMVDGLFKPVLGAFDAFLGTFGEVSLGVRVAENAQTESGVSCAVVGFEIDVHEDLISAFDSEGTLHVAKATESLRETTLVFAQEGGNLFFAQGGDTLAAIDAAVKAFRAGGQNALVSRPGYADAVKGLSQKRLWHGVVYLPDAISLVVQQLGELPGVGAFLAMVDIPRGAAPLSFGVGAEGRMISLESSFPVGAARELILIAAPILEAMQGGGGDDDDEE